MRVRLIPACALVLFGCGAPRTDPPPPPPPPPPPQARLEVLTPDVDLGEVPLLHGEVRWASGWVRARNAGDDGSVLELRVTSPVCVGELFDGRCLDAPQPWRLGPGQVAAIPVAMRVEAGSSTRAVTLSAGDAGSAVARVAVAGVEALHCLVPSAEQLDFGRFPLGCPVAHQTLRLTNRCLTPRLVSSATVAPLAAPFVVKPAPTLPRRLEPGAALDLLLEFTGGPPGAYAATVEVQTNVEATAVVVRGERVESGSEQDTFRQSQWSLDGLVVLDTSLAPAVRAAVVEQVANTFASPLFYFGELRLSVVGAGQTQLSASADGGVRFDTARSGFGEAVHEALLRVPADGGAASCLDTAARFAGSVFTPGPGHAAWCLTDAEEVSADVATSRALLVLSEVKWNVVGPPRALPVGCPVETPGSGLHEQLTAMLGGSFASLCDTPWTLPGPGVAYEAPQRTFFLSFTPVFPLQVTVNGQAVTTDSWMYLPQPNAITFASPPPEGSTITVANGLGCP